MQKRRAIEPQSNRNRLLQPKTRQQRQRRPDVIFVKETKIENPDKDAAPAITTFVYLVGGRIDY